MEDFLEDIGVEVEINPDDQYQFLSVYYFPESVSYRAVGRSILSLHHIILMALYLHREIAT